MICNKPLKFDGTGQTLVGFFSREGHRHNDNCFSKIFKCEDNHQTWIPITSPKCPIPECDWVGKLTCFCHEGQKLDPDSEEANPKFCQKEISAITTI